MSSDDGNHYTISATHINVHTLYIYIYIYSNQCRRKKTLNLNLSSLKKWPCVLQTGQWKEVSESLEGNLLSFFA